MSTVATEPGPAAQPRATALPAATPWFWATVVLVGGMSETAVDWLTRRLDTVFVAAGALIVLIMLLGVQLVVTRHRPWLYWAVVAVAGIVGSLTIDVLHLRTGMSDPTTTVSFIAVTAVVLGVWHLADATIAPDSVATLHQQLFWWGAVGSIFALGTAAADLTASDLGLGYGQSAIAYAAALAVVAALQHWRQLGPVVAFWLAYTLARPLGSTFGHWLSSGRRGLGLGADLVTCVLLVAIVAVIATGVAVTSRKARR